MRALILIGLSVLFVVSCATPEKYDARLNGWLGKTETQLVQKWGKPSAMKILDNGDKVITYTKADDVYVPSQFYIYNPGQVPNVDEVYTPFDGEYDFGPYNELVGYHVTRICQTSFLIQSGIISGWKWRGNDCASY